MEAICIAGPSDNSAMLEGEATLGLEVCTNQSATTTKAEQTGLKTAFKGQLGGETSNIFIFTPIWGRFEEHICQMGGKKTPTR